MSEYLGYRIIVNGITIPDNMIKRGSFNATPQKRVVYSWVDANKVDHEDILENRKMSINFSLKVRSLSEHEAIKDVFDAEEFVTVTYWDDKSCSYKTGLFKMDAPTFTHRNTLWGDILYEPTQIHLVEY